MHQPPTSKKATPPAAERAAPWRAAILSVRWLLAHPLPAGPFAARRRSGERAKNRQFTSSVAGDAKVLVMQVVSARSVVTVAPVLPGGAACAAADDGGAAVGNLSAGGNHESIFDRSRNRGDDSASQRGPIRRGTNARPQPFGHQARRIQHFWPGRRLRFMRRAGANLLHANAAAFDWPLLPAALFARESSPGLAVARLPVAMRSRLPFVVCANLQLVLQ